MITEFFIFLALGVASWFVGLIPQWEIPAEFTNLDNQINGFLTQFNELGAWVPWGVLIACVAIALGAWVLAFGIKGIAWLYSQVPVFGGGG